MMKHFETEPSPNLLDRVSSRALLAEDNAEQIAQDRKRIQEILDGIEGATSFYEKHGIEESDRRIVEWGKSLLQHIRDGWKIDHPLRETEKFNSEVATAQNVAYEWKICDFGNVAFVLKKRKAVHT